MICFCLRSFAELRALLRYTEGLPRVQHAAEATGIEAFYRSGHALVGFDAAAAIHRTSRIGVFEIGRIVRARRILILHRVTQILVEGRVPGPLNEAAARRVIV